MLGAAILWFGWFGFNAGAEGTFGLLGTEDSSVGLIIINTLGATAAAIIGWVVVEKFKDGKSTSVGAASGAVAGLVAITPSCANLTPGWALLLGLITGAICALAIELKWKLGYDDSLDVVGVHLVGGVIGTLYLGFFATGTGLFVGGGIQQLVVQFIAAFAVLIFSFVVAYVLGLAIEKTIGFRVKNEDEIAGIDTVVHGEEGYALVD
ncbi:MAG: ammonia channel protein, partial [Microbacterium sp.]